MNTNSNNRSKFIYTICSLLIITCFSVQATEYLVKYKNNSGFLFTNFTNFIRGYKGLKLLDATLPIRLLNIDIKNKLALKKLKQDPNVEYIVPNRQIFAFKTYYNNQNDIPFAPLKKQWAIDRVQAKEAWQRAGNKGSKDVILSVIDTGIDYNHESLSTNIVPGWNFVNDNANPMDITSAINPGHGTHCAGIIGATGEAKNGTVGISPVISIMPIRMLDERGSGSTATAIKSIDYAISQHVQIISASWGSHMSREDARPLIEEIEKANKAGIVFVVAASNDGENNDTYEVYPAKSGNSNVISVAASDQGDNKPSWSNYGRATVSIASPGAGILSTLPGNKYGLLSGTSMATPLVAGLVALIKAQEPDLNPAEIRSLLQATGDPVLIPSACDCRINAFKAIDSLKSHQMFVHPYAATIEPGKNQLFTAINAERPLDFSSSNQEIATIDQHGLLTALKSGVTKIRVKDVNGKTATSYNIYVTKKGTSPSIGLPNTTGIPKKCYSNQKSCEKTCQLMPELSWCSK